MKNHAIASNITILSLLALLSLFNFSCSLSEYGIEEFLYRENHIDKRAQDLLELKDDEKPTLPEIKKYSVLITTDLHYGADNHPNKERKDDDFFAAISKLKDEGNLPLFCVCLGDIAEHGYDSEHKRYKAEFVDRLESEFGIKTYTVVGNHDLYNSGWYPYSKYIFPGTSFYHFKTETFSWYFIDNASGTFGNHQYQALSTALSNDKSKKLVFTHVPLYCSGHFYFTMQNSAERNKVISLFGKNNVKGVFCGHTHFNDESDLGNFTEYTTGGFLEDHEYSILHVDEENGTFKMEFKKY